MIRNLIILVLCFVLSLSTAAALEVGVGVADITPDVARYKVPMAGYGARMGRPATGVHDRLHAKVLYFRDGQTAMTLVTCDLRSITPGFKQQIVEKTSGLGTSLDTVLVTASHTHAGPSMYPEKFWQLQFGRYDPAIVEIMSSAVAEAVKAAVQSAAPARIGFGEKRAEGFTRNRRWGYDTEARKAAAERPAVDPSLSVMRIDSLDGAVRALLVNFATHPTIAGHENMELSAEWPGVLQSQLEEAFPGAVVLYTNGAQGDQSPSGAQGADDFERIQDFGARLATIAGDIARTIETQEGLSIGYRRGTPELPALAFSESAKERHAKYMEAAQAALPRHAELQVFRLGQTALVGLPGEPILEVGQAVAQHLSAQGFTRVIVLGLANDYIGYLVNEKEYAHGGYEVDSRSYYGPGLGTFIATEVGKTARGLIP